MILTDREIRASLNNHQIIIEPRPKEKAFSSTSVDLTLHENLRVFKTGIPGVQTSFNPAAENYSARQLLENITEQRSIPTEGYTLEPSRLVLGWTQEEIALKPLARVAARVEGKSGLARLGLAIHVTAPTIHAGFEGNIQLEIINLGPIPIVLSKGLPICQIIFEQTLGMPENAYGGQFKAQKA